MAYPPQQQQGPNLGQMFQNVDRDRSGHINSIELGQALASGGYQPFNPETCRLMIGMFDRDGNGQIDFNEFQSLWKYINDWVLCFRGYDRDNSGSIDSRELQTALTSFGYRLSPGLVGMLVTKFDRAGRGTVAFDDFIQLCIVLQTLTASFRRYDTNQCGTITIQYEQFLTMVFSLKIFDKKP